MAGDPLKRQVTIPYNGGSFTTTRGLLNYIFGPNFVVTQPLTTQTISRKKHKRTRVIGGPEIDVEATTFTLTKFPQARGQSASGGQPVLFNVDSEYYTARLHGSLQNFDIFMKTQKWNTQKTFRLISEKNTIKGPYTSLLDDFIEEEN
jgi:hypothetical protein